MRRDRHPPHRPHPPHRSRSDEPPRDEPQRDDPGDLRAILRSIDGAPYGCYRRLLGAHRLSEFDLVFDRVAPDPFARPSRLRVSIDRESAGLPRRLTETRARRLGVEDYLIRRAMASLSARMGDKRGGGPGTGRLFLDPPSQAVLERSGCRVGDGRVELRIFVALPARARRIMGPQVEALLFEDLVDLATSTLLFSSRAIEEAERAAANVEDHEALRGALGERGLVAFVGAGSLLARAGGADLGPRRDGFEIAFEPPETMTVSIDLPHRGSVSGLGIPGGVNLIVGGGFHGKSTLLDAIAAGVHPHCPGDGREIVATVPDATVVRAEDGRSVRTTDISGFLGPLPSGVRSDAFVTEKASGSTSQASSIVEAVEVGSRLLLLDEDRCATNFMIRDGRMQRLVPRPDEPIVPFIDRVRELYDRLGVSTILVTGGSGDYLEVADKVIRMDKYRVADVTAEARQIASETKSMRVREELPRLEPPRGRVPRLSRRVRSRELRLAVRGPRGLRLGDETVDLGAIEQLAEAGQVRALGRLLVRVVDELEAGSTLLELVTALDRWLETEGIDALEAPAAYDLSRPRRFEIAAAMNRWRLLRFEPGAGHTEADE